MPVHRNPNIMKALYGYGYVEGYGDGMHIIREQFQNHPLKPKFPKFEGILGGVKVTLYAAKISKLENVVHKKIDLLNLNLNERQRKAVDYLRERGRIANREYRNLCGVGWDTSHRDLRELIKKGVVERKGRGRGVFYRMIIG